MALSLATRLCPRLLRPFGPSPPPSLRRPYIGYKPKEQTRYAEALETLNQRDVTLFRYEAPRSVFWKNLLAIVCVPMFTYIGYFSFRLNDAFKQYDTMLSQRDDNWVLTNIKYASKGVGVAFFLFGVGISSYWIMRTSSTVRRLVLRKGGKHVTLVTYGWTGYRPKYRTIPVKYCTAVHQTFQGKERLLLQVRDHVFKYRFNLQDGVFSNKPLFDRMVGIARNI